MHEYQSRVLRSRCCGKRTRLHGHDAAWSAAHVPTRASALVYRAQNNLMPVANPPNTRPISAAPWELPEGRVSARNWRARAAPTQAVFRIVSGGGTYAHFDAFHANLHHGQWTKVGLPKYQYWDSYSAVGFPSSRSSCWRRPPSRSSRFLQNLHSSHQQIRSIYRNKNAKREPSIQDKPFICDDIDRQTAL